MKKKLLLKMIIIILFLFIILGLIFIIKKLIPGYKNEEIMDMTNLVINSSNVTDYLKDNNTKVYVKDEVIYLSINDLRNFFDKYIYIDEQYGKIISTYNSNIVILDINTGKVNLNTEEFKTRFLPFEVDGIIYLPFSELQKAYDANCTYITDTNTVIIDTEDKDKTLAVIEQNTKLKSRKRNLSRTIYELKENEEIMIIEEYDKWSKVRTNKGKIGFVLTSKIGEKREIKSLLNTQNNKNKKINMFWDYFYSEESIPDRSGQEFEGINVVSPSFFILDNNGDIKTNIGIKGEKYIEWAHSNKYEVWAMFSNDSQKELTSKILNNYEKRQKLILEIMNLVKKYKLDGINVDFENSKKIIEQLSKTNKYIKSIIVLTNNYNSIKSISNLKSEKIYNVIYKSYDFKLLIETIKQLIIDKSLNYDKNVIRNQISKELTSIGYVLSHNGTRYLIDAIEISYYHNNSLTENLNKNIYPLISKRHKQTIDNIKISIHRATETMYYNCHETILMNYFSFTTPKKPNIKTVIDTVTTKLVAIHNF